LLRSEWQVLLEVVKEMQRQRKKQIPGGNDRKKGNGKEQIPGGNDRKKCKGNGKKQIPGGNDRKKGKGQGG